MCIYIYIYIYKFKLTYYFKFSLYFSVVFFGGGVIFLLSFSISFFIHLSFSFAKNSSLDIPKLFFLSWVKSSFNIYSFLPSSLSFVFLSLVPLSKLTSIFLSFSISIRSNLPSICLSFNICFLFPFFRLSNMFFISFLLSNLFSIFPSFFFSFFYQMFRQYLFLYFFFDTFTFFIYSWFFSF